MLVSRVAQVQALCTGYDADTAFRDLLLKGEGVSGLEEYRFAKDVEVSVVDDESTDTAELKIIDLRLSDGVQRVGVYNNNAWCIVDALEPEDTMKDWANGFDPEHLPDELAEFAAYVPA